MLCVNIYNLHDYLQKVINKKFKLSSHINCLIG